MRVAGWSARYSHSSVAMPDGSIVLMGGRMAAAADLNDVWRFQPAGSIGTEPFAYLYHAGDVFGIAPGIQCLTDTTARGRPDISRLLRQQLLPDRIGIYKDGSWYIDMNGDGVWNAGDQNYGFGAPLWTPVTGDWNNDGKTEIGVYRDGAWYLDYDATGWWSARRQELRLRCSRLDTGCRGLERGRLRQDRGIQGRCLVPRL